MMSDKCYYRNMCGTNMVLCFRVSLCVLQGSDAGFVQKCRDAFQKKENFVPHRGDFPLFSVKHYAAEVHK